MFSPIVLNSLGKPERQVQKYETLRLTLRTIDSMLQKLQQNPREQTCVLTWPILAGAADVALLPPAGIVRGAAHEGTEDKAS